jgi:hypothetical protein
MKTKEEDFICFQKFKAHMENYIEKNVKVLRSNNGESTP